MNRRALSRSPPYISIAATVASTTLALVAAKSSVISLKPVIRELTSRPRYPTAAGSLSAYAAGKLRVELFRPAALLAFYQLLDVSVTSEGMPSSR